MTKNTNQERRGAAVDILTLIAVGCVGELITDLIHEGLGHATACHLTGAVSIALSSADCSCNGELSSFDARFIQAAGTAMNLVAGGLFCLLLKVNRRASPWTRFMLWLCMSYNLFQGGGYLLVSPLLGLGDWGQFLMNISTPLAWRIGLCALGAGITLLAARLALREFDAFIGGDTLRMYRARLLTVIPYLTAGVLSCLSGLRNRGGLDVVIGSSFAATFGGMAWLAFLSFYVKPLAQSATTGPAPMNRNQIWLCLGVAAVAVSFFILGPGIKLR